MDFVQLEWLLARVDRPSLGTARTSTLRSRAIALMMLAC